MGVHNIEPGQAHIQWNAELEAKPVFVVVWRGGEARRQSGRWKRRAVGGVQKNENE
jgi:hypothetical protein